MTDYLILIPVAYVLGAMPFGLIVGRAARGVDVRDYGSGKTGMTNVLRIAGTRAAALVFVLDLAKGTGAVLLAKALSDSGIAAAFAGLAVLAGHNWPVFVGFRGGRGTASGWGTLLALSPISGVVAAVVGIPLIIGTRYVSLGSMAAATAGAIALVVISATGHAPLGYVWFGAIGGTLVVARHHDNIRRLLKGEERKLGQPTTIGRPQSDQERRKGIRWPRSA